MSAIKRDRMPGRYCRPWCPVCRGRAGLDCPDSAPGPKDIRRRLKNELKNEINDLMNDMD